MVIVKLLNTFVQGYSLIRIKPVGKLKGWVLTEGFTRGQKHDDPGFSLSKALDIDLPVIWCFKV